MPADALQNAVAEAIRRLQQGIAPSSAEVAALRRDARELDRQLGAMMRPSTGEEG